MNGDGNGSGKKPRLLSAKNAKLAEADRIEDADMRTRALALLKEGALCAARMSEDEERLGEIKQELGTIADVYGLEGGFKHKNLGFQNQGWQTRSTLRKPLLVDLFARYSIPAEELEACYQQGEPFRVTRIIVFDVE